ncbi:hypothetical protein BD414DRAFT_494326 [Trametes punicea]|nr:hypothetical protein BD414DRAFT_494326 [Trametes punicea]
MMMCRSALLLLFGALNALCASSFEALNERQNPADDPHRTPSPVITRPNDGDKWSTLQVQTVRWDTTGLNVTGLNGTVLLGYVLPNTTRFVWTDQPLADNFALSDEAVNVILPAVPTGERYFMILLGDMNNTSPLFTIFNSTDQGFPTNSPPLSLPAQTMTTQSATISDPNVVSTIGGGATSTKSSLTTAAASSSPTGDSNGGTKNFGATLVYGAVAAALAIWALKL